jgi:hypothetical protein
MSYSLTLPPLMPLKKNVTVPVGVIRPMRV